MRWLMSVAMCWVVGLQVAAASTTTEPPDAPAGVLTVFGRAGLADGWESFGWAETMTPGGPTTIDLGRWGGWVVANRDGMLSGAQFGELRVDVSTSGLGPDALRIRLINPSGELAAVVPTLKATPGRQSVVVPMVDLMGAPQASFDRIQIMANRDLPPGVTVQVEAIALDSRALPAAPGVVADAATVDCGASATPISPMIYGIGYAPWNDTQGQWATGATSRRWGGNTTSVYNWRLGAWNTGKDFYFTNTSLDGGTRAHDAYLEGNWAHGASSAVTIPMLGWVAKDNTSPSFPVSRVGPQHATNPNNPDAGDGLLPDGETRLAAQDPTVTNAPWSEADVEPWLADMAAKAAAAKQAKPFMYFLDNEPELWADSHRDIRADGTSYDELLTKGQAYAAAIKSADPGALVAGPSPFGWWGYSFSGRDFESSFDPPRDRDAHGGVPILQWYLQQMKQYEDRFGVRLLDVLDIHYYPEANLFNGPVDRPTAERRIRSTRSLWDPTYTDQSFIDDRIELIPRMQRLIEDYYPGTKLSIGEYNFGGEQHISGALAQALALGWFGRLGVFAAYYWTFPAEGSASSWAFRAFRNYDGSGAHFGDLSVPVDGGDRATVFASMSSDRSSTVLVAVNPSLDEAVDLVVSLEGCPGDALRAFSYNGQAEGLTPVDVRDDGGDVSTVLAPGAITVIERATPGATGATGATG